MNSSRRRELPAQTVDVAVIGGGICGLTLALQLARALPHADVCVVERSSHPVPEAAHKVGESSVEVQAHYLREVLDLEGHLETDQLRKFGLRMFMPFAGNHDITRRVEFGQVDEATLPSYQLDRGRLENELGRRIQQRGVNFLDGCRVDRIEIADPGGVHQLSLTGQAEGTLTARWVVDASGRSSFLKRRLGLSKDLDHHANAAWFRVDSQVDPEEWTDDADWLARVPPGMRRLSTNHLMGEGYWVWLIPLASGATSVGIVASGHHFDYRQFNTLQRALDFLAEHEPQLRQALEPHLGAILDFRVMRDYAYSSTRVYDGTARWALTGEAAVSIDPLYSSGGDLMAIGNGLICDLIRHDLDATRTDEQLADLAAGHEQVYLMMAEIWLIAYRDQYGLMGNPRIMTAKVVWDTIIYWAVPGLLFFHDAYRRLGDSAAALPCLYRTWEVHDRVQRLFREWADVDDALTSDVFADPYSLLPWIVDLHNAMAAGLDDAQLDVQLSANVSLLEELAGQLVGEASDRVSKLGPRGAAQAAEWDQDPLLRDLRAAYDVRARRDPIDATWMRLGDSPAGACEQLPSSSTTEEVPA